MAGAKTSIIYSSFGGAYWKIRKHTVTAAVLSKFKVAKVHISQKEQFLEKLYVVIGSTFTKQSNDFFRFKSVCGAGLKKQNRMIFVGLTKAGGISCIFLFSVSCWKGWNIFSCICCDEVSGLFTKLIKSKKARHAHQNHVPGLCQTAEKNWKNYQSLI